MKERVTFTKKDRRTFEFGMRLTKLLVGMSVQLRERGVELATADRGELVRLKKAIERVLDPAADLHRDEFEVLLEFAEDGG